MRSLLLVLLVWYWKTGHGVYCTSNNLNETLMVLNVTATTQLELTQFIENITTYKDLKNVTNCLYLSLAGGNNYELDIIKLIKISINGSLVLKSKDGSANINCTVGSSSDLEALRQTLQPLSRASLVLLDGLIFTGCPVPILIEEASNVVIQNCVFQ